MVVTFVLIVACSVGGYLLGSWVETLQHENKVADARYEAYMDGYDEGLYDGMYK